jgi:acetyl esterase/lipase
VTDKARHPGATGRAAAAAKQIVAMLKTEIVYRVGMPFLYRQAHLDEDRIVRDLAYRADDAACERKHRLDLFRPEGEDWPVLVFVHGGNWDSGDRGLRAGGYDVYSNIGRYYASRGIGTAVLSYRLQPEVTWSEQVEDVREATAWLNRNVSHYGGDPSRIVLSGHSAGAQLAAWVAFDSERRRTAGIDGAIRGLVSISAAGLDLEDPKTYELGAELRYYEQRFRHPGHTDDSWKMHGSPLRKAGGHAPPTLILYAGGDYTPLKRQAELLHECLERHSVPAKTVVVPGENHSRILLTLSRPDKTAGPAIEAFVRDVTSTSPRFEPSPRPR